MTLLRPIENPKSLQEIREEHEAALNRVNGYLAEWARGPYSLCWHPWHNRLIAMVNLASRTMEILRDKSMHEHELRLRLMVPVQGEPPLAVREAVAAWQEAQFKRPPLMAWFLESRQEALLQATIAYLDELTALHESECRPRGCTWNGEEVIFNE